MHKMELFFKNIYRKVHLESKSHFKINACISRINYVVDMTGTEKELHFKKMLKVILLSSSTNEIFSPAIKGIQFPRSSKKHFVKKFPSKHRRKIIKNLNPI